jgi:hypothetical protein
VFVLVLAPLLALALQQLHLGLLLPLLHSLKLLLLLLPHPLVVSALL